MRISPGDRIGDLLVEAEIGQGAFATVFRARDTVIDRPVALKVVRGSDSLSAERRTQLMLREARLVGGLKSPHIVTLYRLHALDGDTWMFELELVEGEALDDRLQRDPPLSVDARVDVVRGVVRALVEAHSHRVLHRDIKPGNVLLASDGGVKLTDFGLGRLVTGESISSQSAPSIAGTPTYMAPEVFTGNRATFAADLWSVGVLAYQLAADRLPFEARTLSELFVALTHRQPDPLPADAPAALVRVADACLQRDVEARPSEAAEVLALLDIEGERSRPSSLTREVEAQPLADVGTPDIVLVGRDAEIRQAHGVLDRLEGGGHGVLLVEGDAGIGKTALLHGISKEARRRGMHRLRAELRGMDGARGAMQQALRAGLGLDVPSADPALVISGDRFGGESTWLRAFLAGASVDGRTLDRPQVVLAIVQALRSLSTESPVVLMVDDVQEGNADDVRLLLDVARRVAGLPVGLVLASRPWDLHGSARVPMDLVDAMRDLQTLDGHQTLALGPLTKDAAFALLVQCADGDPLDAAVADVVLRKAEGNPLFVGEVFRELQRSGAIERRSGRWLLDSSWDPSSLPMRFREVVARRLAELDLEDRQLLDIAAVDGVTFDGQAVAAVLGQPLLTTLQRIQRIARQSGIVRSDTRGFRFAHVMHRDVLYEEAAPELRREIHRLLLEHLVSREGEAAPEAQRLARHFEATDQPAKARPLWILATREALAQEENLRAMQHAQRAGFTAAQADGELLLEHPELCAALARCWVHRGEHAQAQALADRLGTAAEAADHDVARSLAVVLQNSIAYWREGVAALDAEALQASAARLPETHAKGWAFQFLARHALQLQGDAEAADRWIEEAERAHRASGNEPSLAVTRNFRAAVAAAQGDVETSESLYGEAAETARRHGRMLNAAISDVNRAQSRLERGRFEGLGETLERCVEVFRLAGVEAKAAHVLLVVSRLHIAMGDRQRAHEAWQASVDLLQRDPSPDGEVFAHTVGARLAWTAADLPELDQQVARLRELANTTGSRVAGMRAALHGCLARAAVHDTDGMQREARAARQVLSGTGNQALRTECVGTLARARLMGCDVTLDAWADLEIASATFGADSAVLASLVASAEGLSREAETDLVSDAAPFLASTSGVDREETRVLHLLVEAETLRRQGDAVGVVTRAQEGADRARRLGHVWLEMRFLRDVLGPTVPEAQERLEDLVTQVCGATSDARAQAAIRRHWLLGGD